MVFAAEPNRYRRAYAARRIGRAQATILELERSPTILALLGKQGSLLD